MESDIGDVNGIINYHFNINLQQTASTPLPTSHYVMYRAQAPNAQTAAVTHPSSQLQLKHTTHIYFHFLNTICKISTLFQNTVLLSMDPPYCIPYASVLITKIGQWKNKEPH